MSDDAKNIRHRFAVPQADETVNKWIEEQSNLGFSLRVLIKAFVRDYGYEDATCLAFGQPVKGRGRPTKKSGIQLENMSLDNMMTADNMVSNKGLNMMSEKESSQDVVHNVQPSVVKQQPMFTPKQSEPDDGQEFVDPGDILG